MFKNKNEKIQIRIENGDFRKFLLVLRSVEVPKYTELVNTANTFVLAKKLKIDANPNSELAIKYPSKMICETLVDLYLPNNIKQPQIGLGTILARRTE